MSRRLQLILLSVGLLIPQLSQSQNERIGVRLIAVRAETEAVALRAQIQAGTSFEALAKAHSIDPSSSSGGYLGILSLTDLRPEFQQALQGLAPGRVSSVTRVDREFVLLQRLSAEEANWIASNEAGLKAFERGRYEEAAQDFRQAVQYAEKLTPADRLEESLHGLAESYRLEKKYNEAEPVYRRYLAMHWGGPGVPEVLDRLSALVALSYFRDSQFDEALRRFDEAVRRGPLGEELYEAASTILFRAQLIPEAEALLVRAVQLFPTSKDVRFRLAQLYSNSARPQKALETFEQLSRMRAPAGIDPDVDRLQQSVVFQKIGNLQADLSELEKAAAAYRKALEILPGSPESRLGLGDVYVRQGRPEAALTEYRAVVEANPKNVAAHFRIADANLRMGRFPDALAAAAQTLTLDATHQRAHYVQATALVRVDRREEGEKELELYRKLEAESRAQFDRIRNIVVLNRGAAAKLIEGSPEQATELFLKAAELYPDAPATYLNLGTLQSKLGRHKDAIETFQKMLKVEIGDSYLIYRNLAEEYRLLGDAEASRRHLVVYLQNIDVSLQEALESNLE